MIKTTAHCDVCGRILSYLDFDMDVNIQGFTLEAKDCISSAKYHDHVRHSCGSTSHPISPLVLPEHICSKKCMTDYFAKWCSELPDVVTP